MNPFNADQFAKLNVAVLADGRQYRISTDGRLDSKYLTGREVRPNGSISSRTERIRVAEVVCRVDGDSRYYTWEASDYDTAMADDCDFDGEVYTLGDMDRVEAEPMFALDREPAAKRTTLRLF